MAAPSVTRWGELVGLAVGDPPGLGLSAEIDHVDVAATVVGPPIPSAR